MKNAETMNEIASHIFMPVALFQIGSVFECWLKALSIWDNAKTLNAMVWPVNGLSMLAPMK